MIPHHMEKAVSPVVLDGEDSDFTVPCFFQSTLISNVEADVKAMTSSSNLQALADAARIISQLREETEAVTASATTTTSTTTATSSSTSSSKPTRRKDRRPIPDDMKDQKYWERRIKNNFAAKRSRETKRQKENQLCLKAAFLEKEHTILL